MNTAIWHLVFVIALVVAWATTHAGQAPTIVAAFILGAIVAMMVDRVMMGAIIKGEIDAYAKRNERIATRQARRSAERQANQDAKAKRAPVCIDGRCRERNTDRALWCERCAARDALEQAKR